MTRRVALLEAKIRNLVENCSNLLFTTKSRQKDLSQQILIELHNSVQEDFDGSSFAADRYIIFIHPSQEKFFSLHPEIPTELANMLRARGEDAGYRFRQPPSVSIETDSTVSEKHFHVQSVLHNGITPTFGLPVQANPENDSCNQNAFLIVNGTDTFILKTSIVNIGRRNDNHLVLHDQRVSRLHAQLRWINCRYVIFDLDSSSGTLVNGLKIHQYTLTPGDVILLGGVPLVFGQDIRDETNPLVI